MQDTQSVIITNRFFKALDEIVAKKEINSVTAFTNLYGIDRRNLYKLKKQPEIFMIKVSLLSILVKDFSVSADWLLTGRGDMFVKVKKI
ncbi:hypothetical protein ACILDU_03805 [Capnocytophaga canimorsus]|uniref:hypothetical protein n=1 Tax=Capnocytophaga canimorsus TaxID=28188 RepID=UPI0037D0DFC1